MVSPETHREWEEGDQEITVEVLLEGSPVHAGFSDRLGINNAGLRQIFLPNEDWEGMFALEDREAFLTALKAKWGEARVLKILLEMEET